MNKKICHSQDRFVQKFPNYEFYLKLATERYNDINEIDRRITHHIINWRKYQSPKEWKIFYDDLEYDHAFIQWIFPNFFKSMFNYNSFRLSVDELKMMKESPKIMEALKESTEMIEKFLGISNDEHNRFKECVVRDTHNRLRIRRILACLKVFDQKQECDFFLNTMIENLQKYKEPKRLEYVIQLFKQYEDDITLKNVHLYLQEDIYYDKVEKHKFYQHFQLIDETVKQDQMVVEAPPQQHSQKEEFLIKQSSQEQKKVDNQDEKEDIININADDQFGQNPQTTENNQNLEQQQNDTKIAEGKHIQQQSKPITKNEQMKNMIQPKQVIDDDDIPIQESQEQTNEIDDINMEVEAQPQGEEQQVPQFDGIYVQQQQQMNGIANKTNQNVEQDNIKHQDEQLNDKINKPEQNQVDAKL